MAKRDPDFVIGDSYEPYLCRWHIIRRNPLLNIYLHEISHDDYGRELHDHPWPFVSFILSGSYLEWRFGNCWWWVKRAARCERIGNSYEAGDVLIRLPWTAHRLEVGRGHALTLVITGPVLKPWGFWTMDGWVGHKRYLSELA